jgi:hypothetical protein
VKACTFALTTLGGIQLDLDANFFLITISLLPECFFALKNENRFPGSCKNN